MRAASPDHPKGITLPGRVSAGACQAKVGIGSQTWFYPNLHGDILTKDLGDQALQAYDPFGQPVDLATGLIGTVTADDAVFDTTPGGSDTA